MQREDASAPALVEVRSGEKSFTGLLTGVSTDSVTVEVSGGATGFGVGQPCWLSFQGHRGGGSSVRLRARLTELSRPNAPGRFVFAIDADDSIALTSLIESRGTLRVAPADGVVLSVEVRGPEGVSLTGALEEVSRTGLSARLAGEVPLQPGQPARLVFRLEGVPGRLDLEAVCRNRDEQPDEVRLGFEFVPRPGIEFARHIRTIEAFASKRVAELLRELRARSA